ncbi:uroplakin-3a [Ascaphus truei]|uniref:uroplakin-3a n=1 Tax=Ascaphus truei TaxID=8439 RepID=UPI003F5A8E5F
MGAWWYLSAFAWLMQISLAQAVMPLLANSNFVTINPTQTAVALEKPFCTFAAGSNSIYLYAVVNGASNLTVYSPSNIISSRTYRATKGGETAPYQVATFGIPDCQNLPVLANAQNPTQAQSILDQYLIRVGGDANCLNDPNFNGICNAPLVAGAVYRFKYVVANANGVQQGETDWSLPITTKTGKVSNLIDSWPGRRSGGMIVLTSILSVLLFLLLAGFIAAVVSCIIVPPNAEPTRHESQTVQNVPQKAQASTDVTYSSTLRSGSMERARYSTQPQA